MIFSHKMKHEISTYDVNNDGGGTCLSPLCSRVKVFAFFPYIYPQFLMFLFIFPFPCIHESPDLRMSLNVWVCQFCHNHNHTTRHPHPTPTPPSTHPPPVRLISKLSENQMSNAFTIGWKRKLVTFYVLWLLLSCYVCTWDDYTDVNKGFWLCF